MLTVVKVRTWTQLFRYHWWYGKCSWLFREEPASVHSRDMASEHAAVKWLLSHPCHIYCAPENLSLNQPGTSQGKDKQDQLSKCIPARRFNRSVIHSTLFSARSPLSWWMCFHLSFLRKHMSVCFNTTYCNRHRQHSPKVFLRTKSFQPHGSASVNGDDWTSLKVKIQVREAAWNNVWEQWDTFRLWSWQTVKFQIAHTGVLDIICNAVYLVHEVTCLESSS